MRKISNNELGRVSIEQYGNIEKLPLVIVVDNVRSLHNIGSIFRSADAFSVEQIYLCGISGTPPNKEIHKSALGAELSVPWCYYDDGSDAVSSLKENGYTIISIEQVEGAVMLNDFQLERSGRYAIVLGNEVKGVSQEIIDKSDIAIEIPQRGTKHSLNVSVAGGVVIWHFFNQYFRD